ncbi:N-terminal binuclear Zn cluster-containing/DNA binding domain-containing protein [Trichoderma longibrachiatum]|uniref:N-terminal binuclear Zn cluster-containing/DNA binding domain-containing protein n=1 Tax=Trichoderma longibrachiatum ATCC 18648 TaxID=983965 RepID=A0A2T4C9M3_TRILO|nr:N-terminal binuclear Zn cluster-containing/DNA binding domain-containing protein [Trichoderma longibrachiatum ATCC 18648]
MPGILPMKVIKVGNSAQSRIAQACDRCRSKKIRCDGVRPTCSQCASVGFECRTSDKLSRRAFPRGYTESLEERVRALESEVRELKDLLDEKDEKIEMLSTMHSNNHNGPRRRPSVTSMATPVSPDGPRDSPTMKEDTFRVQATQLLLGVENSESYFMGSSSGRAFIASLKRKMQDSGKPCSDFTPDAFLHIQGCTPLVAKLPDHISRIPPRIFSDRCVNVFFQEWAPLFPVLHKPTFLRIYEEFVNDPERVKCNYKLAQLHLVFSLAGLSTESPDIPQVAACEYQWTRALESLMLENTMSTLQCLVLALLYCTVRADYRRLQHYKCVAVGLSHRLGLHQSQKRFSFGALTLETRKKVFWTLYALDTMTAAITGLPKMLKEEDVQAEYPSDTDDEYVTEKGFLPTLPGEFTRISSALALFRATRILARVLDKNYPASASYELSLQQMGAFEAELDGWYQDLPAHLKLTFAQGKPSTDVTGSRSPLLSLTYYYIRTLIYRPAVGSNLGPKAAPALISISESSKHIIQIAQLLEERSLSFSFCMNKCDLLAVCALTLLYQAIDLKRDSKLLREDERLVNDVLQTLRKNQSPGFVDLERAASVLITVTDPSAPALLNKHVRKSSMTSGSRRASPPTSFPKQNSPPMAGQFPASASEADLTRHQDKRWMSNVAVLQGPHGNGQQAPSRQSFDGHRQERQQSTSQMPRVSPSAQPRQNLDYLSLNDAPFTNKHATSPSGSMQGQHMGVQNGGQGYVNHGQQAAKTPNMSSSDWEALVGSMDSGMNNVYDVIYGGASIEAAMAGNSTGSDWSPDAFDLSNFNIGEFGSNPAPPQSVLSMSDESLSSGEEVSPSELGLSLSNVEYGKQLQGVNYHNGDGYATNGLHGLSL